MAVLIRADFQNCDNSIDFMKVIRYALRIKGQKEPLIHTCFIDTFIHAKKAKRYHIGFKPGQLEIVECRIRKLRP